MRLAGLITLFALCVVPAPAFAATRQVNVGNNAFVSPETGTGNLTIPQGDSVTWKWIGPDTNHSTTTGIEGQTTWDSAPGNPAPNEGIGHQFSQDFPFVGEYSYFCKVHSFMTGKITVVRNVNDPAGPPADVAGPQFGTPTVQVKRRRVKFVLDEPATVTARLRGPKRKTITKNAVAGNNVLRLPKRLPLGRYGLLMRAVDAAGNKSLVVSVKFRVR